MGEVYDYYNLLKFIYYLERSHAPMSLDIRLSPRTERPRKHISVARPIRRLLEWNSKVLSRSQRADKASNKNVVQKGQSDSRHASN